MSVKLSNTELELMGAAARRDDRCLEPPPGFRADRLQKIAAKLGGDGLAREIRAKAGLPVWRIDEVTDKSVALKLTAAGLKAITPSRESPSQDAWAPLTSAQNTAPSFEGNLVSCEDPVEAAGVAEEAPLPTPQAPITSTTSRLAAPREGTKIANVLELLQRDQGATLDEVVAATGWLPHTSRAALTGLRKRGYGISRRARTEGGLAYAVSAAQSA
jgi:hypothetical protein